MKRKGLERQITDKQGTGKENVTMIYPEKEIKVRLTLIEEALRLAEEMGTAPESDASGSPIVTVS